MAYVRRVEAGEDGWIVFDLHPVRCACADCRNRRLISSGDVSYESDPAAEANDLGRVLRRRDRGQDGPRANVEAPAG